jgi:hypothetical protein
MTDTLEMGSFVSRCKRGLDAVGYGSGSDLEEGAGFCFSREVYYLVIILDDHDVNQTRPP